MNNPIQLVNLKKGPSRTLSEQEDLLLLQEEDFLLLQEEDLLLPQDDLLLVQEQDIMSLEHTYRVHRHHPWSKSKKMKIFDFFPELKDDLWDVEYYHH